MHKMIKLMNIRIILDRFLAIFDIHFFIFQYKEAHMYTNNAYLNHSTIDRKDKSKPLVVTMCGTYKLYTRPKLPTWRPRGRLDFQLIYIAAGKAHFHFGRNSEEKLLFMPDIWFYIVQRSLKNMNIMPKIRQKSTGFILQAAM